MPSLKNWDNRTWLSSKKYIYSFNNFITKQKKLNKHSRILDIGCGRGKIIADLSNKLKLVNKPIGLDIENHKDKSKKMNFKKIDALTFVSETKITFDLILIKQTIHFFKINQINKLLLICKSKLNTNGQILILSLDAKKNKIPTFSIMSEKLKNSLKRDKKIFDLIKNKYPNVITKKFIFNVKLFKTNYFKMIKNRYISILVNLSDKQIENGIYEINCRYNKKIIFKDKLICFILKK